MAPRVNYGLQRAERARAKQAKKEAKQQNRQAQAAARGTGEDPESDGAQVDGVEETRTEPGAA